MEWIKLAEDNLQWVRQLTAEFRKNGKFMINEKHTRGIKRWYWKQYTPLKRRSVSARLHGATSTRHSTLPSVYTVNERDQFPHTYKQTVNCFWFVLFWVMTSCSLVHRNVYVHFQDYSVTTQYTTIMILIVQQDLQLKLVLYVIVFRFLRSTWKIYVHDKIIHFLSKTK
jgi:hypothetical protein